jgi:hypothetical protein
MLRLNIVPTEDALNMRPCSSLDHVGGDEVRIASVIPSATDPR